MELSETIIAAIIGALATMGTAVFQLIRSRAGEVRPRRNRLRSLLATLALMIGCIVGGYAWSSLRAVNAAEEMRATLKAEFASQFTALSAQQGRTNGPGAVAGNGPDSSFGVPVRAPPTGNAETLVQLPPCIPSSQAGDTDVAACAEHDARVATLCAMLSGISPTEKLQVLARQLGPGVHGPTGELDAGALPDLHVAQSRAEQAREAAGSPACVEVSNLSTVDTYFVRLHVIPATAPTPPEPAATTLTTAIAATSGPLQ